MNGRTTSQAHSHAAAEARRDSARARVSASGPVLRRKCDCGTHTIGGGECDECGKRQTLQRRPSRAGKRAGTHGHEREGAHEEAPQAVHEVLRSPGQTLDAGVRDFMETRLGHDFSAVRVHTDGKASESAAAVSAQAYTVGSDIVFAGGLYAPHTREGRSLLAHELTHVAQNAATSSATTDTSAPIRVGPVGDSFEAEADRHASAVAGGTPTRGGVARHAEPGRLSRATYTYGSTKVEVNYGNVINTPSAKMESAVESLFTSFTGKPAKVIHADLAKLDVIAKEWVLFGLDLLVDNPATGLDKVEAVRRLIAHAPKAQTRPGTGGDAFEKEALSVSGWFEKALTSGLTDPTGQDLMDVQALLKRPSGGGSTCPKRTKPEEQFDSKKLESDLPGELMKYLKTVVVPKSPANRSMSPMLPIGDAIQSHARKFFAPYADKGRGGGNTLMEGWKYSAHASSTQTPAGAPNTDMRLSYIDSRARQVSDGPGKLFETTKFDSRCKGDEAVLKGIVQKLEKDATFRPVVDAILEQKSFTNQSVTPKEVFINTKYEASADECNVRWDMVKSMCHELMHVMVHDDFRAAINGRGVLTEGFPEVLGHQLYEDIRNDSTMKKNMESGLASAPCASVPPSTIKYKPHGPNAETIRTKVGDANFRAAFFLGQLSLAGIQPKRVGGEASADPHEAEADAASRAVAESRAVSPPQLRAPSALDSDHLNAGPGRPLEPQTRSFMESRFGHDFSGVRVHTDARAHESARSLNALAYTAGRDIVFNAGQYAPASVEGRRLIAHELAHVVQQSSQSGAGVGPSAMRGGAKAEDSASEREANAAADSALSGAKVPALNATPTGVLSRKADGQNNAAPRRGAACPQTFSIPDDVHNAIAEAWGQSHHGEVEVTEHGGRVVTDKQGKPAIRPDKGVGTSASIDPRKYPKEPGDVTRGTFHTHPYPKGSARLGVSFSGGDIDTFVDGEVGQTMYVGAGSCYFILNTVNRAQRDLCRKRDIRRRYEDSRGEARGTFQQTAEAAVRATVQGCGICYYRACRPDAASPVPKTATLVQNDERAQ